MNQDLRNTINTDRNFLQNQSQELTDDCDSLDNTMVEAQELTKEHNNFVKLYKDILQEPYSINPKVVIITICCVILSVWAFDYLILSNFINGISGDDSQLFMRFSVSGIVLISYIICSIWVYALQRKDERSQNDLPLSAQLEKKPNRKVLFLRILMWAIVGGIVIIASLGVATNIDNYSNIKLIGYAALLLVMLLPHLLLATSGPSFIEPIDKWFRHRKVSSYNKRKVNIQKRFRKIKSTIERKGREFADVMDRHTQCIEALHRQNGGTTNGQDNGLHQQQNSIRPNDYVLGRIQAVANDLSFGVQTEPLPDDLFAGWIDWSDNHQGSQKKEAPSDEETEPDDEYTDEDFDDADPGPYTDPEDDDPSNIFQDENRSL